MLSPKDIEDYRRDGVVVARGVFTSRDVETLRGAADQMWARCGFGGESQNTAFGGVKKMSTIRDPQLHDGTFSRYLTDPKLTQLMAQIVGPNVQLHHSKLNVKTRADRAVFPLHQDHPYFPHAQHSVTTVLVHLTDTTSDRGCFRVIRGVDAPLEHVDDEGHILDPTRYPLEQSEELPAAAGDVVLMNYLTPHGSNLNLHDEPRVLWIIQVRAAEGRPVAQPEELHQPTPPGNRPSQGTMLAGVNPDFVWAASGESSQL